MKWKELRPIYKARDLAKKANDLEAYERLSQELATIRTEQKQRRANKPKLNHDEQV